ncbi:MAG: hypothetical protein Q9219_001940 [cf. Caloplaca sp. 3 TL-2023]
MAGMTPSEILYQQQHINDNRSHEVIGTSVSMAILATAAVTLRFVCRKYMKVAISHDDYSMLAGLMLALALCSIIGYGTHFGTGRHFLAVGVQNTQTYMKLLYSFQIVYAFTLTAIRLSILLFYRRLFPAESTTARWRVFLYICAFLVFGFFFAGLGAVIFMCTPISYFWTRAGNGHCINVQALLYFTATLTIVADISILLLPIPIVWNLQMEKSKRIGVIGIFLLGGFACIASIVRMFYIHLIVPVDPTCTHSVRDFGTQVDPGIWTTVEACIGIVSACLPIIGPAVRSKFGLFGGTSRFSRSTRSGQSNPYSGNSSNRRNISGPLQNKPIVSATVYSRDTQSDEEMAVPLRDIDGPR